jgi:hypothetical protein
MTEEQIREWRDQEKSRLDAIVNPYHRRVASTTLLVLNQVLGES